MNTFDITADMTRQYKAMQEELLGKINELQNTINALKDELSACAPPRGGRGARPYLPPTDTAGGACPQWSPGRRWRRCARATSGS